MIVDGTLIACDRLKADRPFHSGKHKRHGMNIQVVAAPDGEPLWTSWSLPGAVHDTKAARVWKIAERIKTSGLIGLGDKGYVGLSEVRRLRCCPQRAGEITRAVLVLQLQEAR